MLCKMGRFIKSPESSVAAFSNQGEKSCIFACVLTVTNFRCRTTERRFLRALIGRGPQKIRASRQAQEEEAENARRAAEEQASANRAEEEEAASARRAKAEREAEEAKRQEAERRAFSLKVAQEEAIKNSKNNTDKEEAYQNLHECSVIEGFCEIEFKKYTKNGDPRFKDRACADCSVVISTTSAYACKNFWMAEISDPSMCHRPFLCCSCFEAENEYKSGKRKRRKRSLD